MTTPLSDEQLAAMRAREKAATDGPWGFDSETGDIEAVSIWRVVAEVPDLEMPLVNTQADRAFIAAARTDMPALLAEVDRLRAENEHLKGVVQWRDGLADAADIMRSELHECQKRVARLEGVLKRVQWVEDSYGAFWCPVCNKGDYVPHAPDCELAAALRGGE